MSFPMIHIMPRYEKKALFLMCELQNGFRIDLADQRGQKSVQEKQFLDKDIKI